MKRIGILTAGGDCPGLNAAMRGVAKSLYRAFGSEVEIYGIRDGYSGLIYGDYALMQESDFSGILTEGGTILGTSRQPFKQMRVVEEVDKVKNMKMNYKRLGLDCLVTLGGNGTHKTANLLAEEGLNVIGLPKTIDNDIWGTELTFGFLSAVDIGTQVIDRIHTTASSHSRVFIVELMGNKVGWLALYAGIAGGADVILLPEIPYDMKSVAQEVEHRRACGKKFSIVAVAEGVKSAEEAKLSKAEYKAARAQESCPAVSYRIARELGELCGQEVRVAIPGHFQRGGSPSPYDRILTTQFGAAAARLIREEQYGCMVGLQKGRMQAVPLHEVAGRRKSVPIDCEEIRYAREIGVCFGD